MRIVQQQDLLQFRRSIGIVGINLSNGKIAIKYLVYMVITPFLMTGCLFYVVYNWEDVSKRLNGVKGLFLCIVSSVYSVAFLRKQNQLKVLLNVLEGGTCKFPFPKSQIRFEIEKRIYKKIIRMCTIWYYLINCHNAMLILIPVVLFFVEIIKHNLTFINANSLYLSLPVYFPEHYDNLLMYFILFTMEAFYFQQLNVSGYALGIQPYISMYVIEGDLKLLQLSVKEMDSIIKGIHYTQTMTDSKSNGSCTDKECSHPSYERAIRTFLLYFVKHHNDIYRKVNNASDGMEIVAFTLQSGISMLLCTVVYGIITVDELIVKSQESLFCLMLICAIFFYNATGQQVSNQDEMLREELYQIPWTDKPLWFQKSLLIILTRMNQTSHIKKTGMFLLNLKSFVTIIQAVYSFYNVVNNFTK